MKNLTFNDVVLYGLCAAFAVALVSGTWGKLFKGEIEAMNFEKRAVHDIITSVRKSQHGRGVITVLTSDTKIEDEYALYIRDFLDRYELQKGDSVAKVAESRFAVFYRKVAGKYVKFADLDLWKSYKEYD
jgi:hypothetical protein